MPELDGLMEAMVWSGFARPLRYHGPLGQPRDRAAGTQSGHFVIGPQRSEVVKEILDWLDRYLGPVNR